MKKRQSVPHKKFENFKNHLTSKLVERGEEIELSLIAMICNEHVCLVSAPGTAKSMLAEAVVGWLHGSSFSYLLTKFTTPEEIFGPISIEQLKKDRYMRIIDGKLPTADVAFLDEIWKANSAILNTTLQILNERKYWNNGELINCPLKIAIAASNEWPTGDAGRELGALFDRFLLRKEMRNVSTEAGLRRVIWGNTDLAFEETITAKELDQAHVEAKVLPWEEAAEEAFMTIIAHASEQGIQPGNRRHKKAALACNASAWLEGEKAVSTEHLGILAHCLWTDPSDQPREIEKIVRKIAAPTAMLINGVVREVLDIVSTLPSGEGSERASAPGIVAALNKIKSCEAKLRSFGESNPKVVAGLHSVSEQTKLLTKMSMDMLGAT